LKERIKKEVEMTEHLGKQLHIYVLASPLTARFMMLWRAKQKLNPDEKHILITDDLKIRRAHVDLILEISEEARFDLLIEAHELVGDETSFAPTRFKRFIRKTKALPVLKQIYNGLFGIKIEIEKRKYLRKKLQPLQAYSDYEKVHIYCTPECKLLPPLRLKYPHAKLDFFEHGILDYKHAKTHLAAGHTFNCVFHEEMIDHLGVEDKSSPLVLPAFSHEAFAKKLYHEISPDFRDFIQKQAERKGILIMMQVLERYSIPHHFWTVFMDHVFEKLSAEEQYFVILKPHPVQDPVVVQVLIDYFSTKDIPVRVYGFEAGEYLPVEFLYGHISSHIDCLVTPFSSSIFYLKKFFPDSTSQYVWGIDLMLAHAQKAAPNFRDSWMFLRDEILPIFGKDISQLKI
jgi:hypothetical protein